MKTTTLLALAASALPALAAPAWEVLKVSPNSARQVEIGWSIWIGKRSGLAVCSGIPPPCQLETTWIIPNNLDNACDRFGTGSPFPQPSTTVQYCDIEFGHEEFCNGEIFHMAKVEDSDCGLDGGEEVRFAGLFNADNELVGECNKAYSDLDGESCVEASGSSVLDSLLKCTVDYAAGRCNAI